MEPRRLKEIVQLRVPERLAVLSDGLELLYEQAETLRRDLVLLGDADRARGHAILTVTANEECAKALILLDLVRTGWTNQNLVQRQLRRFYDHLPRMIYAELSSMRPADFAEVYRLVETYRSSHYLDGPNGVDFVYRNQALREREEALYVDYVRDEEGFRWVSPPSDGLSFGYGTHLLDLVVSLGRIGVTSREGLEVVASVWSGRVVDSTTKWVDVRAANEAVVGALSSHGLTSPEADEHDGARVVDFWGFPLTELDLEVVKVTPEELAAERERHLAELGDY